MSDQTQLREPDPVDWNKYADGGGGKQLPPKGEYLLTVTKAEEGATRDGYLQYVIDAKVQAPGQPFDGFETRFNRFNTKKWEGREACGLGDFCRAHGITTPLNTNADYKTTVPALVGRQFRAMLDWEIYDSASGYSLRGMDNFPEKDGRRQTSIQNPNNPSEKLFANVRIKYPISTLRK